MLRFAPSPNGYLHLGHALSALANEAMGHALGLPLTVRIEDIDKGRAREEFVTAILEDLAWLGIDWTPPMRRQSEHFAGYRAALDRLKADGLVYPSYATRREILAACNAAGAARDPDGAPLFPGDARVLGERELSRRQESAAPAAWRLDMAGALARVGRVAMVETDAAGTPQGPSPTDPAAWGDVVLARKDTPTSYHLSVVVDDAAQGITHIVRGEDLRQASAVHRVLQELLGLPAPLYHHHRLIIGPDGRKLSKSNGAQSLAALRQDGVSAREIRERLGTGAPAPAPAAVARPARSLR